MALIVIDDKLLNYQMVDAKSSLKRIVGQIFRLLPTFEEGQDWIKPIDTLIIELTGMALSLNSETKIYQLIYKLQGIKELGTDIEFMLFRRMVFEACGIANEIQESL